MNITDGRTGARAGPPRWVNRIVRAVLHSPAHGVLDTRFCELRYRARQSGRTVALPVAYAIDRDRVVVMVGAADRKRWWRTFRRPWPVSVLLRRRSREGVGRIVGPSEPGYAEALLAYRMRHHLPSLDHAELLVVE